MEVKYTNLVTDAKLSAHTIKSDLTPALGMCNGYELAWKSS
jgi:hypothetical protein